MATRVQEEQLPYRPLDWVARLVVVAALGLVFVTFRDYGVPWDGQGEAAYGELLVKYYASWLRDQSFVSTHRGAGRSSRSNVLERC